jgi:hypothetical protein
MLRDAFNFIVLYTIAQLFQIRTNTEGTIGNRKPDIVITGSMLVVKEERTNPETPFSTDQYKIVLFRCRTVTCLHVFQT